MEKTEKIPLLIIYKQNKQIIADMPEEILDLYQLYGFLEVYTADIKKRLGESLSD